MFRRSVPTLPLNITSRRRGQSHPSSIFIPAAAIRWVVGHSFGGGCLPTPGENFGWKTGGTEDDGENGKEPALKGTIYTAESARNKEYSRNVRRHLYQSTRFTQSIAMLHLFYSTNPIFSSGKMEIWRMRRHLGWELSCSWWELRKKRLLTVALSNYGLISGTARVWRRACIPYSMLIALTVPHILTPNQPTDCQHPRHALRIFVSVTLIFIKRDGHWRARFRRKRAILRGAKQSRVRGSFIRHLVMYPVIERSSVLTNEPYLTEYKLRYLSQRYNTSLDLFGPSEAMMGSEPY